MPKSAIDLWANFLANEKLHPVGLEDKDVLSLLRLAEAAASVRPPKVSQYKDKVESRRFLVLTAMQLGIDLPAVKRRGRVAMRRGLLDAWNVVYKARHGSTVGTSSAGEAKRRDIVTKLRAEGIAPPKRTRGD